MKTTDKKKHSLLLFALAIGMFGFGFALVPLYNVFCEVTGINGKTSNQAALIEEIDLIAAPVVRDVTIEFVAMTARGMPWEFEPLQSKLVVQTGEISNATFHVRNRAPRTVIAQAIPSVSPGQAARYLRKIECFCFSQQELAPGDEMNMGVTFFVDANLPPEIKELTLSYTLFQIGEIEPEQTASLNEPGAG